MPDTESNPLARENIELLVRMEEDARSKRSPAERAGDAVAGFAGSLGFVAVHVVAIVAWILINLRLVPGVPAFDPYPFVLLSVTVSCEAVILSAFVLMKQNRMSRRTDHRDHLALQISLLAEREITQVLRLQQKICEQLGIASSDEEIAQLARDTSVETLAKELEQKLPVVENQ
jgi:uncharacterized membrane protein